MYSEKSEFQVIESNLRVDLEMNRRVFSNFYQMINHEALQYKVSYIPHPALLH